MSENAVSESNGPEMTFDDATQSQLMNLAYHYWLDVDCGEGYVDETGDYRYHEDLIGEVVAVEPVSESRYPVTAIEAEKTEERTTRC